MNKKIIKYQISFIVCTYNSGETRTFRTINSIGRQKNISFEIIVCDDGSDKIDRNEYEKLLNGLGVNYKLIFNTINQGTIKNLLSGLYQAEGKYVLCLGPGDMVFSETSGSEIYNYADKNNLKIVFGKAVPYEIKDKIVVYENMANAPKFPNLYNKNISIKEKLKYCELYFPINGTCIFREKDTFITLLEEISEHIKYKEDYGSIMLALIKNINVSYYNINITWYEYGTGISNSSKKMFSNILYHEDKVLLTYFIDHYGYNRRLAFCTDISQAIKELPNKKLAIRCFLKYPVFFIERFYFSRLKTGEEKVSISIDDMNRLDTMLQP